MSQPLDPQAPPPALQAPAGIAVETPAVRSFADRQLTWRIRPSHALSGNLRILLPGETLEKTIQAGDGPSYLSDRRVRSAWDLLWHPAEKRLPPGPVDWIQIAYPPSALRWGWIELPWIVWLFLFSLLSPLLLRRVVDRVFLNIGYLKSEDFGGRLKQNAAQTNCGDRRSGVLGKPFV